MALAAPAASAVATDIVLNPALQSIQSQISSLTDQVNDNNILTAITANAGYINDGFRDLTGSLSNISTAVATGNFTTLQSINGLGSSIMAQNNQSALQSLNSFNLLNTNVLQGFNTSQLQSLNSFNQVLAGLSAQNAQMAECCCDIKTAIASDGDETRALINSLNVSNLTQQLNDAKTALTD